MGGRACLRDTGVTASTVLALLAVGHSREGVLEMFPALEQEDIREALAYAAHSIDELERRRSDSPDAPETQPAFTPKPPEAPVPAPPAPSAESSRPESKPPPPSPAQDLPEPDPESATEPPGDSPHTLHAEFAGDEEMEDDESQEEEPALELYHPSYPDKPTIVLNEFGLLDRRWGTRTIAWADILDIQRVSGAKTILITLRNPEDYLVTMPFLKRLQAKFKLALKVCAFYIDTASLGVRTKDLHLTAHRLWLLHRGGKLIRKKRRVRIGRSGSTKRPVDWDDNLLR